MKIEADLMRGVAPMLVLKLLDREAMYGYELIQAIDRQTEGLLSMGHSTVYPLLYNLEAKGQIEGAWREGPTGRDRKYYRPTPKGKRRLARSEKQWKTLVKGLAPLWPTAMQTS
jgi:PadR family transcriptional regulator PadR